MNGQLQSDMSAAPLLLQPELEQEHQSSNEIIPLETLQSYQKVPEKPEHETKPVTFDTVDEEALPKDPSKPPRHTKKQWIKGLLFCALGMTLALAAHLAMTLKFAAIAAADGHGWGSSSAVLYNGDCVTASQRATGLRVLVNVIILTITATSSYCCQILSAPSRPRINVAHSQRVWVSIGSSSFTNIWYAPPWRKLMWIVVTLTSIPIQMTYNSFIYVSIGVRDVSVVSAPESFAENIFNPAQYNVSSDFTDALGMNVTSLHTDMLSKFEELDPHACMNAYGDSKMTSRSTLVVLGTLIDRDVGEKTTNYSTTALPLNISVGTYDAVWNGESFIFKGSSPTQASSVSKRSFDDDLIVGSGKSASLNKRSNEFDQYEYLKSQVWLPGNWSQNDSWLGFNVTSCYSLPAEPACQLCSSLPIGLTVLGCIALKVLCILITALERRKEIILTVGDAIASFLRDTDPYTANNCLMTRMNKGQPSKVLTFNNYAWSSVFSRAVPFNQRRTPPPQPKKVSYKHKRWSSALPKKLFASLIFFKVALIALAIISIRMSDSSPGISGYFNKDTMSTFTRKVDSLYNSRFLPRDWNFITLVLFVNFPQVVITFVYAIYNNTLSRMLLASEYSSYATERKPLRVSFPSGQQRSTYYLSMPYRYTVPFLMLFTLAHWLTSEALSFAQIIPLSTDGHYDRSRIKRGTSISPLGLKVMVIPELLAVVVIFTLMMRRLKSSAMPISMNCSAAISAACHPPPEDFDASEKPVQWGEVDMEVRSLKTSMGAGLPDIETECRHCSFTSLEVKDPDPTVAYY